MIRTRFTIRQGLMAFAAALLAPALIFAAVLLFIFFKGMDWAAMGDAFRRADPLYMAGVVLITIAIYALRAWRWG